MNIKINGKIEPIPQDSITVSELLELKQVKYPDMVSVQLNGEFVERILFDKTTVNEDDEFEFLYFMGGGSQGWDFATRAIHSCPPIESTNNPTVPPIYQSAAFSYDTAEEIETVFDGRGFGYIYSRISNPTVTAFEYKINSLENGVGTVAAASGMSAILNSILALAGSGEEIIASKSLFSGTRSLFDEVLSKLGIKVIYADINDTATLQSLITDKTRLVFCETIGNPLLDITDFLKLADLAHKHRIPLIADSTLTTPYLFKAKDFGVDIVVHSATKYLTGNGTAVGGVITDLGNFDWNNSLSGDIRDNAKNFGQFAFLSVLRKKILQNTGGVLSPFNAFLHNLGVETLSLRMERHCTNASELALYLSNHKKVKKITYPGLNKNPYYALAKNQFSGKFGALLNFSLESREDCFKFISRLKMTKNLANLGDSKTMVIHPASTLFSSLPKEHRLSIGITDEMIRVSIGIEAIRDIIEDFENALS
jgi:O-acetylhomoserine (thiol)-lyase